MPIFNITSQQTPVHSRLGSSDHVTLSPLSLEQGPLPWSRELTGSLGEFGWVWVTSLRSGPIAQLHDQEESATLAWTPGFKGDLTACHIKKLSLDSCVDTRAGALLVWLSWSGMRCLGIGNPGKCSPTLMGMAYAALFYKYVDLCENYHGKYILQKCNILLHLKMAIIGMFANIWWMCYR